MSLPVGAAQINFNFSGALSRVFTVNVTDGTPPPPPPNTVPATSFGVGNGVTVTQVAGGAQISQVGFGGHGHSLMAFDFVIPTGMSLADFATVTFTYTGISGDFANKNLRLLRLDGWDGGWMSDDINGGSSGTQGANNRVITSIQAVGGIAANAPQAITLNIVDNAVTRELTGTVRLGFYIHANNTAVYVVSDMTFTPRD